MGREVDWVGIVMEIFWDSLSVVPKFWVSVVNMFSAQISEKQFKADGYVQNFQKPKVLDGRHKPRIV